MALRLVCAWLVALLALPVAPLQAQNFFQSLFGSNAPSPRPYGYPAVPPHRSIYGSAPFSPYHPYRGSDEVQPYDRGGTVRTLCVRLCDGFYFPISNAAARSELARDADKCSAMCSAEARLFYYPNDGGSVETMVDLTGRAYSSLRNAFIYRKTLVQDCRCRPQPWSEAELRRHRSYEGQSLVAEATPVPARPLAVAEESTASNPPALHIAQNQPTGLAPIDRATLEQLDSAAPPPRVASADEEGVTVISNERLVARPQPVARQMQAAVPPPSWFSGANPWSTSPYIWSVEPRRRAR
jgi:uncharacterized protein DUF2865